MMASAGWLVSLASTGSPRRTSSRYTIVARKKPSAICVRRSPMKVRIRRKPSWFAASVSTTIVIEMASVAIVIIEERSVARKSGALRAGCRRPLKMPSSGRSMSGRPKASAAATRPMSVGTNQRLFSTASHAVARRDRTGRKMDRLLCISSPKRVRGANGAAGRGVPPPDLPTIRPSGPWRRSPPPEPESPPPRRRAPSRPR